MSRQDDHKDSDAPAPDQLPDPGGLQDTLGHQFKNTQLLTQALTHASAAKDRLKSNERLEFLGDRVLGLVIAELLLENFPDEDEGKIGYRFSALARRQSLARVAQDIGLAQHIDSAISDDGTGRRINSNILADCCEAVIAAIYIDAGLDAARNFIIPHWRELMIETPAPPKDSKTTLQEWAQGKGFALPYYRETDRHGPAHAPRFTIEVTVGPKKPMSGKGSSKQAAEQAAAKAMLENIGVSE